jgi:hypothetical protein
MISKSLSAFKEQGESRSLLITRHDAPASRPRPSSPMSA